ncbi:type 1 glutamine amidotransferase [Streptomyces sp. TRM70308]|uniref:type 1 glutamine amidotransferase n=1 Tax=Streptomyces sp. TRM70308 TaxID=3131932 RepID=UPI003D022221
MRALVVRHEHASQPGFVGERLAERGWKLTTVTVVPERHHHRPAVRFDFPDPRAWDLVIALGAPWSVYDHTTVGSWVGDETAFLRAAHDARVAVLGICFGAQVLASALGGTVEAAPRPEIGWTEIATDDPGLVAAGPWFQWHGDRCVLPDTVTELARTGAAPQAFASGRSLGVQFHPEVGAGVLLRWLAAGGRAQLTARGVDPDRLLERTRAAEPAARVRAHRLVDAFLDRVAGTGTPLATGAGTAG